MKSWKDSFQIQGDTILVGLECRVPEMMMAEAEMQI
jgi:hypothetical protein